MKSFLLRLGDDLHELVRLEAVESRRSMQAVVLVALEEFLGEGATGPVARSVESREGPKSEPEVDRDVAIREIRSQEFQSLSKEDQAKGKWRK